MKTKALGKGLSALINSDNFKSEISKREGNIVMIPLEDLTSGKFQPRTTFNKDKIQELANSIKENGVVQPILVRPSSDNETKYEIIAGERRWQACILNKEKTIPAIIKNDIQEKEVLELALIENIQREDLTPLEEAEAYKKLKDLFSYTQEKLALRLGKSRSHITNILRILSLPDDVKILINDGKISMGHAKALINTDNPSEATKLIINENLSVRDAENLVLKAKTQNKSAKKTYKINHKSLNKDPDIINLEETISQKLGLETRIEESPKYGRVTIKFTNLSELDKIIEKLSL